MRKSQFEGKEGERNKTLQLELEPLVSRVCTQQLRYGSAADSRQRKYYYVTVYTETRHLVTQEIYPCTACIVRWLPFGVLPEREPEAS